MDIRDQLQASLGLTYALEQELGDVGPWRVFLAIDAEGGKVLVKVLSPERAVIVDTERFLKEVEFAGALQHPMIAPVLTVGVVEGLPFYVMPLVKGVSMRARLDSIGELVLPVEFVQRVLRGAAEALDFAHANGVVHGDLTPDKLFDVNGSVVVTDFGIWQALIASRTPNSTEDPAQIDAAWLGTPAYMAPEQAAEDPSTDQRADLYGFGCVAYELLTGRPPFVGSSTTDLIVLHATGSVASLQAARLDAPSLLTRIVMRCLQKDAAQRPATASEVLRHLDPAGLVPEQEAATGRGARAWKRRTVIAGAVVAVVVIVVAGLGWYVVTRKGGAGTIVPIVAVMPFKVSTADRSVQFLREGVMDLIAEELSPIASTHLINSRAVMAAWRRTGGSETADISMAAAAGVALRVGADRVVTGEVTGDASALTITAMLADATTRRELGRASVQGTADRVPSMVDALVTKLLGVATGGGKQSIASIVSPSPVALRAFLAGQSAFRLGKLADAGRAFSAALDADSTAPLIALRLLEVSARRDGEAHDERAARIAMQYQSRLPARSYLLMNLLIGRGAGRRYTGAEYIATAESWTVAEPDSPDAWAYLGDGYYRYGVAAGINDAERQAERTTTRALMLDSTFAPALQRRPAIYAALHDTAGVRRSMNSLSNDAASDATDGGWLIAAYELGDSVRLQAYRSRIPAMSWTSLTLVVVAALEGRASIDDAERAVAVMERRASTTAEHERVNDAAYNLALNRGQPKRAEAINARNPNAVKRAANTMSAFVFWDADSQSAAVAARAVAELRRTPVSRGLTFEDRMNLLHAFFFEAEYRVSTANIPEAQLALSAVQSVPFPEDSGPSSLRSRFQMLIELQLALLNRGEDVRDRLVRLDSALRVVHRDAFTTVGALMAARSWEAVGDRQAALDALSRPVREWESFEMFASTRIRERGRLHENLDEKIGAVRSYRLFLKLRNDPEPSLRAGTDGVRARLAALIENEPKAR